MRASVDIRNRWLKVTFPVGRKLTEIAEFFFVCGKLHMRHQATSFISTCKLDRHCLVIWVKLHKAKCIQCVLHWMYFVIKVTLKFFWEHTSFAWIYHLHQIVVYRNSRKQFIIKIDFLFAMHCYGVHILNAPEAYQYMRVGVCIENVYVVSQHSSICNIWYCVMETKINWWKVGIVF